MSGLAFGTMFRLWFWMGFEGWGEFSFAAMNSVGMLSSGMEPVKFRFARDLSAIRSNTDRRTSVPPFSCPT